MHIAYAISSFKLSVSINEDPSDFEFHHDGNWQTMKNVEKQSTACQSQAVQKQAIKTIWTILKLE